MCKGDTGGPALRESGGRVEVVAVNSTSWQGGCLGTPNPAETRTGAVDALVDDLAGPGCSRSATARSSPPRRGRRPPTSPRARPPGRPGWRHPAHGHELRCAGTTPKCTLYQGADDEDPRHPFAAEYQLAEPPKAGKTSIWQHAKQITGASFGGGTDGLVVRWGDGELTQYTHVDAKGFHGARSSSPRPRTPPGPARHADHGGPLQKERQAARRPARDLGRRPRHPPPRPQRQRRGGQDPEGARRRTPPGRTLPGSVPGSSPARIPWTCWCGGRTARPPSTRGVDTAGFHGETNVRPKKSDRTNATAMAGGAFVANDRSTDVIVRWAERVGQSLPGVWA